MHKDICIFSISHTNLQIFPFNNCERTMRLIFPNNITSSCIKILFKNQYATNPVWIKNASIAICKDKDTIIAQSSVPITVNGDTSFAIVPEKQVYSDEINIDVYAGCFIAISLYYPQDIKITSGNLVANLSKRSDKGDYTQAENMPTPAFLTKLSHGLFPWDATNSITTVSCVQAKVPQNSYTKVVAAFGDSICQQGTWTTPFTARLYKTYPNQITFCNMGIGGNRFLHDSPELLQGSCGEKGIKRYLTDLTAIKGLTHVIFALGTNDIGLPGKDNVPNSELITLDEYISAVKEFTTALKSKNIKVVAATILPRALNKPYDEQRETLRIQMNEFIRNYAEFDAVLDFAQVVKNQNGDDGIRKDYFQPDGLHPNILGGKAIADSIDITLFS